MILDGSTLNKSTPDDFRSPNTFVLQVRRIEMDHRQAVFDTCGRIPLMKGLSFLHTHNHERMGENPRSYDIISHDTSCNIDRHLRRLDTTPLIDWNSV